MEAKTLRNALIVLLFGLPGLNLYAFFFSNGESGLLYQLGAVPILSLALLLPTSMLVLIKAPAVLATRQRTFHP